MKVGIDQIKKLFLAVIAMGNACGRAFEDKKIGLTDIDDVFTFIQAAKDMATEVDFNVALPEFKDIDDDEMAELMEIVEQHFDIPEEMVEDKVKQIFGLIARQYLLIGDAISMVQNPEAVG